MSHANDRIFDHDAAREWKLKKTRSLVDKRMDLSDAIARYVEDGDAIIETGFAYARAPLAAMWEIARQKKKDLVGIETPGAMGPIFCEQGLMEGAHIAYCGIEMRGPVGPFRRSVEAGKFKVYSEWTHAAMAASLQAAEQGLNYVATKTMLGTDTLKHNRYVKQAEDPWTGEPVVLVPAIYPDVAIFHVHNADVHGNSRVWGLTVNDLAIAAAARKVVVTCERIVSSDELRTTPTQVIIPWYCVDAVCEVPYGAWPGDMPSMYYFDRKMMETIVRIDLKQPDTTSTWVEDFVYGTKDHYEMIDRIAAGEGMGTTPYLKRLEHLAASAAYYGLGMWGPGAERDWHYEEVERSPF